MRRKHAPKSAKDFAILYNDLEKWRIQETAKIKSSIITTDERTQAMSAMLEEVYICM
jgi:hypothetical protein